MSGHRSMYWCLSIPSSELEQVVNIFEDERIKYCIGGTVKSEHGNKIEVFVKLCIRKRKSSVMRLFPNASEIRNKRRNESIKEHVKRIKLLGDFVEYGDIPEDSWEAGGRATQEKWKLKRGDDKPVGHPHYKRIKTEDHLDEALSTADCSVLDGLKVPIVKLENLKITPSLLLEEHRHMASLFPEIESVIDPFGI